MRHISRRTFLAMASTLGFGGLQSPASLYAVAKAYAQPQAPRVVRIAHLSRRQGPDAEMAAYAIMGAQLGAEEADVTAGMFGTRVELIIEDAVTPENVESLTASSAPRRICPPSSPLWTSVPPPGSATPPSSSAWSVRTPPPVAAFCAGRNAIA